MKTSFKDDKAVKGITRRKDQITKRSVLLISKNIRLKKQEKVTILLKWVPMNTIVYWQNILQSIKQKGDIPPEIITRDETSKYLKQQYANALKEGGFYGKISEKARQYGITSGTGSVDLGTVAGLASTGGIGLRVAAGAGVVLGGSQSTRQAERGQLQKLRR